MYAAKLGCKAAALQRTLWGDFAYQPKTKRIVRIRGELAGRAKPLFVQLALEPIWKVGRVGGAAADPGIASTPVFSAHLRLCDVGLR